MDASKIGELTERLAAYLEDHVDPAVIQKRIWIDGPVGKDDLTPDCLKSLLCLQPFGEENGRPVFLLESLPRSVFKEIDGTLKMGEIVLVGQTLAAGEDLRSADTLSLVVSPFVDGSARLVEVIDWKPTRQAERGRQ